MVEKTVEVLKPFETQNLMNTIQTMTLEQLFTNWVFLLIAIGVIFFGVYKKSKAVLLTVFFLLALIVMVKFAMPSAGQELGLKSLIPFICFGLGIGGVIVYFSFVKD
jgi:uncharacterized membrane protein YiaA